MKKILFSMVIMGSLCHFLGAQHLLRVNNNPAFTVDYTTLQAAVDAATSGDTIYMEGSTTNYAGATINKQLTIVGPGYFLNENPKTQANMLEVVFNSDLTFTAASGGSSLMGCRFTNYNAEVIIGADDISVIRNYLGTVSFSATCNNILLSQNYVYVNIQATSPGAITNSIISNNIIGLSFWTQSTSGPLVVSNNVFTASHPSPVNCFNANIQNNIVTYGTATIELNTGNSVNNNILAEDGTDANGNQYNIDMTTVFADFDGQLELSTDGKWELLAGSPALGAGVSGVDCGLFGGASPYILSGIPNLPHIYEASVQAASSSEAGLEVTIQVKSGDE